MKAQRLFQAFPPWWDSVSKFFLPYGSYQSVVLGVVRGDLQEPYLKARLTLCCVNSLL
jgi:hypothetical protein